MTPTCPVCDRPHRRTLGDHALGGPRTSDQLCESCQIDVAEVHAYRRREMFR